MEIFCILACEPSPSLPPSLPPCQSDSLCLLISPSLVCDSKATEPKDAASDVRAASPAEEQTYIYITPCKHDPAAHTHKASDDAAAEEASDGSRAAMSSEGIHTHVWMQCERTHTHTHTRKHGSFTPHERARTHIHTLTQTRILQICLRRMSACLKWCLVQVNCTRSHLKSHPIPGLLAWRLALPCVRVHKPGRHRHGPKVSHNKTKSHRRQKDPREHTQTP